MCQPVEAAGLASALSRIAPGELILGQKLVAEDSQFYEMFREWRDRLTPLPDSRFDSTNAERRLKDTFGVSALDAYGDFDRAELAA